MDKSDAILSRLNEISRNWKDPAMNIAFPPRACVGRQTFQVSLRLILDALDAYHSSPIETEKQ